VPGVDGAQDGLVQGATTVATVLVVGVGHGVVVSSQCCDGLGGAVFLHGELVGFADHVLHGFTYSFRDVIDGVFVNFAFFVFPDVAVKDEPDVVGEGGVDFGVGELLGVLGDSETVTDFFELRFGGVAHFGQRSHGDSFSKGSLVDGV